MIAATSAPKTFNSLMAGEQSSNDVNNLMYALMVEDLRHFTLGQAYRINVDSRSAATVLRAPTVTPRQCSLWCSAANDGVCPSVLFP